VAVSAGRDSTVEIARSQDMPKMKTKRGAAKRFKVTGSGRVKRSRAYRRHILTTKSRKKKRQLRRGGMVAPANERAVKSLIPYL
jgi:large subunit ribosomal protein L35